MQTLPASYKICIVMGAKRRNLLPELEFAWETHFLGEYPISSSRGNKYEKLVNAPNSLKLLEEVCEGFRADIPSLTLVRMSEN